jgi:chromosome segregation ATPase
MIQSLKLRISDLESNPEGSSDLYRQYVQKAKSMIAELNDQLYETRGQLAESEREVQAMRDEYGDLRSKYKHVRSDAEKKSTKYDSLKSEYKNTKKTLNEFAKYNAEYDELSQAAIKIQSSWRGHKSRKQYKQARVNSKNQYEFHFILSSIY